MPFYIKINGSDVTFQPVGTKYFDARIKSSIVNGPLTTNADIKIKNGELIEGKVNDKTGIITWEFMQGISGSKSVFFDYSIDAQYGIPLYLE